MGSLVYQALANDVRVEYTYFIDEKSGTQKAWVGHVKPCHVLTCLKATQTAHRVETLGFVRRIAKDFSSFITEVRSQLQPWFQVQPYFCSGPASVSFLWIFVHTAHVWAYASRFRDKCSIRLISRHLTKYLYNIYRSFLVFFIFFNMFLPFFPVLTSYLATSPEENRPSTRAPSFGLAPAVHAIEFQHWCTEATQQKHSPTKQKVEQHLNSAATSG